MKLKFLKNKEIEYRKWDLCISKSINCQVFAYSWYLDCMSSNWAAIVHGDYEKVLPLIYYSKLKYNVIFQPIFVFQLGIYSTTTLNEADTEAFINFIPEKFKKINLNFNKHNIFPEQLILENKNYYTLDLIEPYSSIVKIFSWNCLKSIQTGNNNKYFVKAGVSPHIVINYLKNKNYFELPEDYDNLRRLISKSLLKKISVLLGVYDNKNKLLGLSFFIFSKHNVNLLFLNCENVDAAIFLINYFIKINSKKNISLHLDGKYIENIKELALGFNFQEFFYSNYNQNRIPKIFRLFKKF